jgi:hypothetical protein
MGQRQLNIRSDDAAERAARLARLSGKTTTEVVVEALRTYEVGLTAQCEQGWTEEKRRRFEALQALSAETARHVIPGAPDDHNWLYDESGLPK